MLSVVGSGGGGIGSSFPAAYTPFGDAATMQSFRHHATDVLQNTSEPPAHATWTVSGGVATLGSSVTRNPASATGLGAASRRDAGAAGSGGLPHAVSTKENAQNDGTTKQGIRNSPAGEFPGACFVVPSFCPFSFFLCTAQG